MFLICDAAACKSGPHVQASVAGWMGNQSDLSLLQINEIGDQYYLACCCYLEHTPDQLWFVCFHLL